jgi:DNA-binding PadR family transcriptional regulator
MKGDYLGAFEELVLLAVAGVGAEAYGITVQERVERDAGRTVSLGAVYAALDRLEAKQYVASWLGDTSAYRGGRRKRHFSITADGTAALREMRRIRERMWRAVDAPARLRQGSGG